ncbi:M16 family metallopeptidase [Hyphobacterium sp.]|uniref:M16 family metallopeptidase n=1 Tax=Hyphobacterium sp. TaxID=2004662 RepID=UPI003BAC5768
MSISSGLRFSQPLVALMAAVTVLGAPSAFTWQGEGFAHDNSDIAPDPSVTYGMLENGMRYAIMENDTPPNTASIRMALNVGSLVEDEDQRGLAHFLEHMAFNGSENVPEGEMVALLERYGLQFGPDTNAGTGRELVVYQLDMPETDADTLGTGLFLMRETASNLTMTEEAIDRERNIILSEERVRDTPIRRWQNALLEFRYPGSLAAQRDAIGIPEVISTAPREAFLRYYEEYYTPDRTFLSIVGDFDAAEIEAMIIERFSDWEMPEDPGTVPVAAEVDADRGFDTGYFQDPDFFTVITVESIKPDTIEPDTVASRYEGLLDSLGNSILTRRFSTIVNSGTSPLIQAGSGYSTDEFGVAARANILAVSQPERWEEAMGIVEQERRRALEFGFTQSELDEQLINLRTGLETAAEQADTRGSVGLAEALWGSWLSETVFSHPADALERFNRLEETLTLEAVNAAFREQWEGNGPLVLLASSLEIENAEAQIAEVWNASTEVAVAAMEEEELAAWAYEEFGEPGEVLERTQVDDLDVTQLVFDNGVSVTLKQTDFETDLIRINLTFGHGDLEPIAEPVVDTVAGNIFTAGGLEAHSIDELQRVLAGRNVGGSFGVSAGGFNMSGTTTSDDLLLQFQLFAAYFTAPGFRPESLAQYRATLPESLRSLGSTPGGVRSRELGRMLRSGDQRYGFPTLEEAMAIDLDDVRAFLMPALENAPIEVTVVGDFEEQAVVDAIASTLGAMPDRAGTWPLDDSNAILEFPDPTDQPIVLNHNGGEDQALVNVYWPTTDDTDPRRSRTLRLMRAVLALKLTETLREAEAFTYSAASSNVESFYHPDYGYLYVGADVTVDNVEEVYATIDQIAEDMANGEITDDELLRARRPLLEQIQNAFESNGVWLSWLTQSIEHPERLDRIRSITSDYESISLDEIVDVARTYIRDDTAYRVSILPNADR